MKGIRSSPVTRSNEAHCSPHHSYCQHQECASSSRSSATNSNSSETTNHTTTSSITVSSRRFSLDDDDDDDDDDDSEYYHTKPPPSSCFPVSSMRLRRCLLSMSLFLLFMATFKTVFTRMKDGHGESNTTTTRTLATPSHSTSTRSLRLRRQQEEQEGDNQNSSSSSTRIDHHGHRFLLAILPDTQYYSEGAPYILQSQTRWIAEWNNQNRNTTSAGVVDFVIHVGDIIQSPQVEGQWNVATAAMRQLEDASIAYGIIPGNHDLIRENLQDIQRSNVTTATTTTTKDSGDIEEPYLQYFGGSTTDDDSSTGGSSDTSNRLSRGRRRPYAYKDPITGYNEYHLINQQASSGDRSSSNANTNATLLVLCLDYRASLPTLQWAEQVLQQHDGIPTILVTHELLIPSSSSATDTDASSSSSLPPRRSQYGTYLWDNLISTNNQIVWTVSGHYTSDSDTESASDMLIDTNDYGQDVIMTIINYQHLHAGGNGQMRFVELAFGNDSASSSGKSQRLTMHHMTFSPFVLELYQNTSSTNNIDSKIVPSINPRYDVLQRNTSMRDDFSISIPVNGSRFTVLPSVEKSLTSSSSSPLLNPIRQYLANITVPNVQMITSPTDSQDYPLIAETIAHWRFHDQEKNNTQPTDVVVRDSSGLGNHLILQTVDYGINNGSSWLRSSIDHHPLSSSSGSICFDNPTRDVGSFLTTIPNAQLDTESFVDGYTIEAFVKLSSTWTPENLRWTSIVSKRGEGRDATTASTLEGDINEPLAQLGFSPSREFQWATYSTNRQDMATAWSASQRKNEWIHVAVTNDGSSVTLYVDGTPARRDPVHQTPIQGISMATLPNLNGWNVGASTYNGRAKMFGGGSCIGEVRIVRGALLAPQDFLLSRRRRA